MNCKAILAVALVALVALQLAGAHPLTKRSCACGLKGVDVCGSCIPAAVPRPVRPRAPVSGVQRVVYQKFAPVEFKPQDVCTCEGGLVTAPEIPRVACKVHGPVCQPPNYAFEQGPTYGLGGGDDCGDAPVNPCEDNFVAPTPVRTYVIPAEDSLPAEELIEEVPTPAARAPVAADAVSLALAYDRATRQQKNILEENLAFGPMQAPKDGRIVTKKRIVPEGGLYAVRNQVVELKTGSGYGRSCDDDAAEAQLLAAQQASCGEVEESSYGGSLPSYRDLGFAPVGGECNFVPGSYQPAPQVVQTVEYAVSAPKVKAAPAYTPCDALATVERGRGSEGYDYYASGAPETPEVSCAEGEEAVVAPSSDIYSAGLSYGVPAPTHKHSGRPGGCSCGGY